MTVPVSALCAPHHRGWKANSSQGSPALRQSYSQPAHPLNKALGSLLAPLMNNFRNRISDGVSEKLRVEVMVEGDPAAYRGGCAPRSRARRRSLRIALPYANNEAALWRSGCRTLKPRGRRSIRRSRLTENLSRCVRTRVRLPTNDSGEHARPACGVRRLANNGFPARRRKIARGDACAPQK